MFKLLFILLIFSICSAKYTYRSYQNKIECYPQTRIKAPRTIAQLGKIVNKAINNGTKIKVIGSRHSVTDVICTSGIPIRLKHFNQININEETMTVTLGSGLQLMDALEALHLEGYTINHIPAYGGITIGGAIALGAHGSSLKHATSLSEYLVGITFIDGKGEIRKMDYTDADFDSFRVNLGLLGIIIEATLNIVPQFKMKTSIHRVNHSLLMNNTNKLIKIARKYDFFEFVWYPANKKIAIIKGKYIPTTTQGNAYTNALSDISTIGGISANIGYELIQKFNASFIMNQIQRISLQRKGDTLNFIKPPLFSDNNKHVNPAIGYGYKLMASRCTDHCLWKYINLEESSYSISIDKLLQVVEDINNLLINYPIAFPLSGLAFRFSPASKGIMALSNQKDTFHIDWAYPIRTNPFEYPSYGLATMQALSQLLIKHGGKPHWGKNGLAYFKHEFISSSYPPSSLNQFKKMVEKYDPDGLFSNKFGNRILGIEDQFDIPDKVQHCALQDYCICKQDEDCSNKCGSIMDYSVCV